jgi:Protein of unknown function (DUF2905)
MCAALYRTGQRNESEEKWVPFDSLGKMLVVLGLVIVIIGAGIMVAGRIPFLGSLPGDLSFERSGVRVYIPIVTSIVVSILLTVVLNLVLGLLGRR